MKQSRDNSTDLKDGDTIFEESYFKDDFSATEGRRFAVGEIVHALDRSINNSCSLETISHLFGILKGELENVGIIDGINRNSKNCPC